MNETVSELTFSLSKPEPSDVFGIENYSLQCEHENGNRFSLFFDRVTLTRFNDSNRVYNSCLEARCKPQWPPFLEVFCREHTLKPMFSQLLHLQRNECTKIVSLNRFLSNDHISMPEKRAAILFVLTRINPECMFYCFDQSFPHEVAMAKSLTRQQIPVLTFTNDAHNNRHSQHLAGKSVAFFNYMTFA